MIRKPGLLPWAALLHVFIPPELADNTILLVDLYRLMKPAWRMQTLIRKG
jgi:hypothetical protein